MIELLSATAAGIIILCVAVFLGRKRKQEGLGWLETQPENVARLYLRSAADIDVYWLHAQMTNGKKRLIAAPWEVEETLLRLKPLGLQLTPADRAALEASLAHDVDSGLQDDCLQRERASTVRVRAPA